MINVIVTYRVRPEFVEENKLHIQKFMEAFKALDTSKFMYNVFLKDDGVTFVHCSNFSDAAMQQQVLNVPSFMEFQKKRDESGLNDSHTVELLECIGSSSEIL